MVPGGETEARQGRVSRDWTSSSVANNSNNNSNWQNIEMLCYYYVTIMNLLCYHWHGWSPINSPVGLNGYRWLSIASFPAVQGGSPWARDSSSWHQRTCSIVHDTWTWRAGECTPEKCISRMENIGKWKMPSPLGFSAETWYQATQAWWVIFKGRSTQILRRSPVQTVHRVHRVHRVLRRSHRHFTCHPSQRSHGFFGFCSFKPFWARRRQKILATPASPCPAHV